MRLDGSALVFVVQPGVLLARSVAVVGKLTLTAAVELLLPLKAGVAHQVSKAKKTKGSGSQHRGKARLIQIRTSWPLAPWRCPQEGYPRSQPHEVITPNKQNTAE